MRGGYVELINVEKNVRLMFEKVLFMRLCSNTTGQVAIDAIVKPPRVGEPSHEQWLKEKSFVLDSLTERARIVTEKINSHKGFSCQPINGAMYAFPRIDLPPKAIEAANKVGQLPDVFYACQLLEETGAIYLYENRFSNKN